MSQHIIWGGLGLPHAHADVQDEFAVCVEDNRIIATGGRAALQKQYPEADVFGGREYLLLPTFTNAHDHGRAIGSASLGAPDDILEIWLKKLGGVYRIPPELAAQYESIKLLTAGVSGTAHSHNAATWSAQEDEVPLSLRGYAAGGVRVAIHPVMIDQNTFVYFDADKLIDTLPEHLAAQARQMAQPPGIATADYIAMLERLHVAHHDAEQHTVHIQASPAGGQWCSDELVLACVEFANQHKTRVQIHMLETPWQRAYSYHTWGKSFMKHLNEIGALGDWLTFAHMVWVDEDDLPLIAERGAGISHNPSSNIRLRSGIAPVRAMLNAGVRTGIGLDGHSMDDDQDYLREMRLAWKLSNNRERLEPPLDARTFLHMGTVNGAEITFGAPLGKLETGYLADLMLIDWEAVRGGWCPDGYPSPDYVPHFLLTRASRQHVRHVMVNGEWKVRDGAHTQLNRDEVAAAIREAFSQQSPRLDLISEMTPYLRDFHTAMLEQYRP